MKGITVGQVQEQVQIETGLDALDTGKYGHFAKDCPNMKAPDSTQPDQMQQLMDTE